MRDEVRAALIVRLATLYPDAPADLVEELVADCEAIVVGLEVGDVVVRTEQLARARLDVRYG